MSEYQYFEFQALDRPLDAQEQATLRRYSTRASISARRFTNEYHWGDFKGDTIEWMKKYFDAHVYLSNFGSRTLHFRLPLSLVDRKAARVYGVKSVLAWRATATHGVFSFYSDEDPGRDDDQFDEAPSAVLGALLPVREALVRGDLRPLYLGWLLAVQNQEVDDEALEPPVPPGLDRLDGMLEALRDFLWLDPALVEVAARRSEGEASSADEVRAWLAKLPAQEKDAWLLRFLHEEEGVAVLEFRRRFLSEKRRAAGVSARLRRSAGELRQAVEALAQAGLK